MFGTAITPPPDLELMLRILLAFVLGGVIGYERETTQRPAGLRTHMLVAARVAAQIVTGVGFLGAGTIWRTSSTADDGEEEEEIVD